VLFEVVEGFEQALIGIVLIDGEDIEQIEIAFFEEKRPIGKDIDFIVSGMRKLVFPKDESGWG
jgi:hypothetical protein